MTKGEHLAELAEENMGEGGLFVYDLGQMTDHAAALQAIAGAMPHGGMTVRYAAKANPHPTIIDTFDRLGLSFDASSTPEAAALLQMGVGGDRISLSSQVLRDTPELEEALGQGVRPVATSVQQIGTLARAGAESGLTDIALRINPGSGSGGNKRTTVGGPAAPFGIWKEDLPLALAAAQLHGLSVDRIHTHIGSGVDPSAWQGTIRQSLDIVEACPETVTTLDIGGGYKVARMPGEPETNLGEVLDIFRTELEEFREHTGREIRLEIEPGTWLVANAGILLGRVEEVKQTPEYNQLILNVGMNAVLRISHYGAQHPIAGLVDDRRERVEYAIFGPCCESGDILTPAPGNPEEIAPRELPKMNPGEYVAIGGAGAYCASMSATGYNHVPEPTDVFVA